MRKTVRLLFLALLACSNQSAWACSCDSPPAPKEALEKADAVFLGSVERLEVQRKFGRLATFRVMKVWKGPQQPSISVFTEGNGTACGFDFEVGNPAYLVYAYKDVGKQGGYSTNTCTRTRTEFDAEKDDLKVLGPGISVGE